MPNGLDGFQAIRSDVNAIPEFVEHSYSDFLIHQIIFSQENQDLCLSLRFFTSMSGNQRG